MNTDRTRWVTLAVAVTGAALFSISSQRAQSINVLECGNATAPSCLGDCPAGQGCFDVGVGNSSVCACAVTGCCQPPAPAPICVDNVADFQCVGGFVANGTCADGCGVPSPTPTTTTTQTGTPTNTPTPGPDGADCADPADCVSGNCVDDVCCDSICDQPGEACNLPNSLGQCTVIAAPAPAASEGGLLTMLAVLLSIGGLALLRRQRRARG